MTSTGGKEAPAVVPVLLGNALDLSMVKAASGNTKQPAVVAGRTPASVCAAPTPSWQRIARSVHQRSSYPRTHNSLHLSHNQIELIVIDKEATIDRFQVLRTGAQIWAAPNLSQPLFQPPKSKCTYFLCTTTFLSTCTLSQLSHSHTLAHSPFLSIFRLLTLSAIAHSTTTRFASCS